VSFVGDTPLQFVFASFEWLVLLVGAVLLVRTIASREKRTACLRPNRLPYWPVNGLELSLLLLLVLAFVILTQSGFAWLFGARIKSAADRTGLEVFVFGIAQHGGALLAWPAFAVMRTWFYSDHGIQPVPLVADPAIRSARPIREGLTLLLMAMPVLIVVNILWNLLLVRLGLPDEPQDLLGAFNGTKSPLVIAGMLLVACVVAPVNEEMIFRAGIYRFIRQRLGRAPALWFSSLLFGSLHVNWTTFNGLASFIPLALLGAVFALIYEKTGCIWVSMLAHGLFNLNTIAYILSGLPQ
jgi:membrane protease YdiL (CAAX protease family)